MTARAEVIWSVWCSVARGLPGESWLRVLGGMLVWLIITGGVYGLMSLWRRQPVRHWAYASRGALLGHWLAGDMDFRAVAGASIVVLVLADLVLPRGFTVAPVLFACWSAVSGVVMMMLFNTGRCACNHHLHAGRALVAGLVGLQTEVMALTGWALWSGVSGTTA